MGVPVQRVPPCNNGGLAAAVLLLQCTTVRHRCLTSGSRKLYFKRARSHHHRCGTPIQNMQYYPRSEAVRM